MIGQLYLLLHLSFSILTRAVAAMDSCFGLVMASSVRHSHRAEIGLNALYSLPFTAEAGTKHPFNDSLIKNVQVSAGRSPKGDTENNCLYITLKRN